jgi:hypothetical protein
VINELAEIRHVHSGLADVASGDLREVMSISKNGDVIAGVTALVSSKPYRNEKILLVDMAIRAALS